jgi:hypothetical protein
VNIYEIDWRFSSTQQVFQALSDALKNVENIILDEAQADYEREDGLEHAENLLGIAFVAAQIYIAGTVSDVNQFAKVAIKLTKDQLVKTHSEKITEKTITKLELCDALANYYKHHDEWESWLTVGRQQKTIATLQAAGIKESDSYPCMKAAEILWLNTQSLESLLSLI